MRFVWQGKKTKIKIKAMQDANQRAGFGLPDSVLYYRARVLVWMKEWIMIDYLSWKDMIYNQVGMLFYGTKKDKEQKGFNSHDKKSLTRDLKKIYSRFTKKHQAYTQPKIRLCIEAFI